MKNKFVDDVRFVDDASIEAYPGQTNDYIKLLTRKEVGMAVVKTGSILKEGTKVRAVNWQENRFSCILLEDSKPYRKGDIVYLEKWELNFKL